MMPVTPVGRIRGPLLPLGRGRSLERPVAVGSEPLQALEARSFPDEPFHLVVGGCRQVNAGIGRCERSPDQVFGNLSYIAGRLSGQGREVSTQATGEALDLGFEKHCFDVGASPESRPAPLSIERAVSPTGGPDSRHRNFPQKIRPDKIRDLAIRSG